ncbi:hypothetical protein CC86DRAFT_401295 [Ophiobolus disseminans]|uniref:Calcineurin-like phosphoesterase domain-containing protein n=1 Tax=Ophiobolus disseminans TaxID=1469910 RepID=A0A6A7AIJ4_9PLEO|nr:hypothetical protein CC86DRAFT_401295 [Ophiobolus disseminans]
MGNHEAYGTTTDVAIQKFEDFERATTAKNNGTSRFYFLNRRRVDVNERVTVLGCTLWTLIPRPSFHACATLLTDFHDKTGIWDRSIYEHTADHRADLTWLNDTVSHVSSQSPEREIIILTHHSPTLDSRANHPRHARSKTNDGFRADLSKEVCWTNANVSVWGFGHTYFDCQFYGEGGKLLLANQKRCVMQGGREGGRLLLGRGRVK